MIKCKTKCVFVIVSLVWSYLLWHALTRWYLKYVFRDTHPRPMCLNTWKTFVAEPSAKRTAIQNRKFPAGI